MTFESHPNEEIHELTANEELDIDKVLERPESVFEKHALNEEQQRQAVKFHEAIIAQPELFLGAGNDGVVFAFPTETNEAVCLKNIWEELTLEIKEKRSYLFPPKLKELNKIKDRFNLIREEKRKARERGIEFVISNTPAAEAGLQVAARMILEEAGFENAVPAVKSLVRIEAKDEGAIDGYPFVYKEVADVIMMDQVLGKSIQDFVLEYDNHEDVLEALDPEAFRKTVLEMFEALHERNLTHQDVTKRNIMLDFKTLKPVIIDFGKASHGAGNFSKDEEMGHVDEVCRALSALKKDPEKTRRDMKRQLKIA